VSLTATTSKDTRRTALPVERREAWRLFEVAHMLGVSLSELKILVREGRFPQPVELGRQLRVWRAAEIRAWLAAGAPSIDSWTWRPTQIQTISQLIRELQEEAGRLTRYCDDLRREIQTLKSKRDELYSSSERTRV